MSAYEENLMAADTKSLRQLMALLYLLGCDVNVEVKERRGRAAT